LYLQIVSHASSKAQTKELTSFAEKLGKEARRKGSFQAFDNHTQSRPPFFTIKVNAPSFSVAHSLNIHL
jgi:hypothetical protein